jgi:hypothetical protein
MVKLLSKVSHFMKDLDYYLRIIADADGDSHLSLIQNDISGGRISREDIDVIQQHPNVTAISISGLQQDTFDYFIENYGSQFEAINFWKCPLVTDLSKLSGVEYITYYWNQRAEQLWDFSKTTSLKGLNFDDFTRMHDISQVAKAPALVELSFGNKVWPKYILNTLEPLRRCAGLKSLSFSAKKIVDYRVEPIAALDQLEKLEFPSNLFSTEQVAWLKTHLPPTVDSKILNPYWQIEGSIKISGKDKDTFIVGKRKPFLDSVKDRHRVDKYVRQFNEMVQWYSENPSATPEDYQPA